MELLGNIERHYDIDIHFPDKRIADDGLFDDGTSKLPRRIDWLYEPPWNRWSLRIERKVQVSLRGGPAYCAIGVDYAKELALDEIKRNLGRWLTVAAPRSFSV
jgi:hypothetical protein